ncbi:hypothetical protein Afe04nite_35610 [Asanoa ferruginea]|nr:hypothetical protein Afe04nite_35610 [Asanoa ferruginea]
MQAGIGPCLGECADAGKIGTLGQLGQRRNDEEQGALPPVVPRGGRPGWSDPLLSFGEHGPQRGAIGGRRRHQPGIGKRGEGREEHPPAGVNGADEQGPRRGGGKQPQEQGPQQPGNARIARIGVNRQMPGAEQRHNRRKPGVIERLGGADAYEGGDPVPAQRRVFKPRVKLTTKPPGGKHAGRGPQLLGEFTLRPLIGYRRPNPGKCPIGSINSRGGLAVQRGGLYCSRLRPGHTAHLPG